MDAALGSGSPLGDPSVSSGFAREPDEPLHEPARSAQALLEAFTSISSDLDTRTLLLRITTSACELSDARYGALAVVAHDGQLADLVTHGLAEHGSGLTDQLVIGKELPDPQDLGTDVLAVPIRVRGTLFGRLYVTRKARGRAFDERDAVLAQSLAAVAGFVIENARSYAVSERRRRWLEMFGELSDLLMPPITLADALERIASALLDASGAESASVVQVPENGTPFPAAVCGEVLELTEEENQTFSRAVRSVVDSGEVLDLAVRDDWVAVLAPLRAHLTMPGVLILTHPRWGRPDALEERELLSSFADQAALALDRTQALEEREQMAVISDRDRIARELHDVVIQRLFATGLHMQSIRSAAESPELKERIDQSVKDLDQTIRAIRGTIFELQTRPQSSLRTEVRDVVRDLVPQLGFAPSVHTTGPVDNSVDPKVQQQLVAVLREALTNVAQHAAAGDAVVELQVTATHLRLKVSDDGKGMPAERHENGLRDARRRALLLGGSLDLWPNEPSGTVFVWSVPYEEESVRQR